MKTKMVFPDRTPEWHCPICHDDFRDDHTCMGRRDMGGQCKKCVKHNKDTEPMEINKSAEDRRKEIVDEFLDSLRLGSESTGRAEKELARLRLRRLLKDYKTEVLTEFVLND